jgi:hypothetical protein
VQKTMRSRWPPLLGLLFFFGVLVAAALLANRYHLKACDCGHICSGERECGLKSCEGRR